MELKVGFGEANSNFGVYGPTLKSQKSQRKDIQVPSLCEEVCKGILSH